MTPESSPSLIRSPAVFWLIVVVLLFLFIAQVSSILLPFVLGMLLAYLCDPFADRLRESGMLARDCNGHYYSCLIYNLDWWRGMVAAAVSEAVGGISDVAAFSV